MTRRARDSGASAKASQRLAEDLASGDARESLLAIEYAQYGGLTTRQASVMVLLEQVMVTNGATVRRNLTIDVRLERSPGGWTVIDAPASERRPRPRALTPDEERLLANARIRLPAAAVADVRAGIISPRLVSLLNDLGRSHTLDVMVLRAGHPRRVFGTDRISNHTVGRGVDIWRVDGHLVADPSTPRDVLRSVMEAAAEAGATEVGGPFDVNGEGGGFFTNDVHRDHIHAGINPGLPPAGT